MFVRMYWPGTGIQQLLDDNDDSMRFSDLENVAAKFGTDFTGLAELVGSNTCRMDDYYPKPPYTYDNEAYATVDWLSGDVQHASSTGIVENYFSDIAPDASWPSAERRGTRTTPSMKTINEWLFTEAVSRGYPIGAIASDLVDGTGR